MTITIDLMDAELLIKSMGIFNHGNTALCKRARKLIAKIQAAAQAEAAAMNSPAMDAFVDAKRKAKR